MDVSIVEIRSSQQAFSSALLQTYENVEESALRFIEAMRLPESLGAYRISATNPVDLYACTYVPQILTLLGRLDWLSSASRDSLINQLQCYQSDEGYFEDNVSNTWKPHVRETNLLLMSALASSSLALLGHAPSKEMRFLEGVMSPDGMQAWFDDRRRLALMSGASWSESIATECLAVCLIIYAYHNGIDIANWDVIETYFGCLESLQDKWTGFWGIPCVGRKHRLKHQISEIVKGFLPSYYTHGMGTTFHMVDIYAAVGRPWHYARRIAENTVRSQQSDGLFNPEGGGSQCHDLDAISILANLYKRVPRLTRRRIRRVMMRTLKAFVGLKLHNPDGGFRNRAGGEPYQKGNAPLYIKQGESDLLSTWFRLATIAYIDLTLNHATGNYLRHWQFPQVGFLHHANA